MKQIKKLYKVLTFEEVLVIKRDTPDLDPYSVYGKGHMGIYFILMIPIAGNVFALLMFIASLVRTKQVEVKGEKEDNIVFSSVKQGDKK